ncbi:MAG: FtsX-like permease family protein [Candidatus Hodarchaeales archaeon]
MVKSGQFLTVIEFAYSDLKKARYFLIPLLFYIILFSGSLYGILGWGAHAEKSVYENVLSSTDYQISIRLIPGYEEGSLLKVKNFIDSSITGVQQSDLLLRSQSFQNASGTWFGSYFFNASLLNLITSRVNVVNGSLDINHTGIVVSEEFAGINLVENGSGYRPLTVGDRINITTSRINDSNLFSFMTVEVAAIIEFESTEFLSTVIDTRDGQIEEILGFKQSIIIGSSSLLSANETAELSRSSESSLLLSLNRARLLNSGSSHLIVDISKIIREIEYGSPHSLNSQNLIEKTTSELAGVFEAIRLTNTMAFIPAMILIMAVVFYGCHQLVDRKRDDFARWYISGIEQNTALMIITCEIMIVLPAGVITGVVLGQALINTLILSRFTFEIGSFDMVSLIVTVICTFVFFLLLFRIKTKTMSHIEPFELFSRFSDIDHSRAEKQYFSAPAGILFLMFGLVTLCLNLLERLEILTIDMIYFDMIRESIYMAAFPALLIGGIMILTQLINWIVIKSRSLFRITFRNNHLLIWKYLKNGSFTRNYIIIFFMISSIFSYSIFALEGLENQSHIESQIATGGDIRVLTFPHSFHYRANLTSLIPEVEEAVSLASGSGLIGMTRFTVYAINPVQYLNSLAERVITFKGKEFTSTIKGLSNGSFLASTALATELDLSTGNKAFIQVGLTTIPNMTLTGTVDYMPGVSDISSSAYGEKFIVITEETVSSLTDYFSIRDYIIKLAEPSATASKQVLADLENISHFQLLSAITVDDVKMGLKNYRLFGIENILVLELVISLAIGLTGLVIYTSHILPYRRAEFGVLMSFGVTRRNINFQLLSEFGLLGLLSLSWGVIIGLLENLLFDWIIDDTLSNWFKLELLPSFNILSGMLASILILFLFLIIFLLFILNNLDWTKIIDDLRLN